VSRGSQASPRSAEYEILLDLIRQAREDSGMTQKAICDKLGKPKNYLIKVERGERRLDVVELFALCEAMGADPMGLLGAFRSTHIISNDSHLMD
jgi:transcriptional regulator with XRE-family HTH domain